MVTDVCARARGAHSQSIYLKVDMVAAKHRRDGTVLDMLRAKQRRSRQLARDGYHNCPRKTCQALFRQMRQTAAVCGNLARRQVALRERLMVMLRKSRITTSTDARRDLVLKPTADFVPWSQADVVMGRPLSWATQSGAAPLRDERALAAAAERMSAAAMNLNPVQTFRASAIGLQGGHDDDDDYSGLDSSDESGSDHAL